MFRLQAVDCPLLSVCPVLRSPYSMAQSFHSLPNNAVSFSKRKASMMSYVLRVARLLGAGALCYSIMKFLAFVCEVVKVSDKGKGLPITGLCGLEGE
jgi:hypothetical protein